MLNGVLFALTSKIIIEIISQKEGGVFIMAQSFRAPFRGGATFSGCVHCGISVYRHRKIDYIPVDRRMLTGNLFAHNDPDIGLRHVWVEHICDPERVDEYASLRAEVAEKLSNLIQENQPPEWLPEVLKQQHLDAKESLALLGELTTRLSLTRPCSKCGADVGESCENLSERKRGNTVATKNPHLERMPYGESSEPEELSRARQEVSERYRLVEQTKSILSDSNALERLLRLVRGESG